MATKTEQGGETTRVDLLWLNFAMIFLSGPSLFAKAIQLPPQTIVFGRAGLAAVTLYLFFLISKQSYQLESRQDRRMILLMGVLMAAHWVALVQSIQVASVAIGMIAVHTHPIITILLEPWVFSEKFKWRDLGFGAMVLLGVVVLVPELSWSNETVQGVTWGVLSALLFAIRNVYSRRYVRKYPGTVVLFYQMVVVALVLAPLLVTTPVDWPEFFSWKMLALGVIFTAGGHSIYVGAMSKFKAKTVGIVSVAQVPYSIVLAFFLLAEVPTWRAFVGGAIILGVVAAETIFGD